MIRTILIDDEPAARDTLRELLTQLNLPIEIVGEAGNIQKGKQLIEQHEPDLLFLDVQLKEGTGFHLLQRLSKNLETEVVFVTAFDKYAIRAFQMAAFGYLLKPLEIKALKEVVQRFQQRKEQLAATTRREILMNNEVAGDRKKIIIKNVHGFRIVDLGEVIYLRGEVNYTRFILKNGEQIMVSRTLRDYDNLLSDLGFLRIHQSFLIHLTEVVEYLRGDGGTAIMSNGDELQVSRRRKTAFIGKFLGV